MSLRRVLDALAVPPVPYEARTEGTEKSSNNQSCSLCSPCSLANRNDDADNNSDIDKELEAAIARSVEQHEQMMLGNVPAHYVHRAHCERCGPIWFWQSVELSGCPWCWNRKEGLFYPQPECTRCVDCMHYEPIDHPFLGHCAKGEAEAPAGIWGADLRHCIHYLPKTSEDSGA